MTQRNAGDSSSGLARRMAMRPGTRVVVTAGRYEGRTGVVSEPADADGVVTVRLEATGGWPWPEMASVMGRYLQVVAKPDPMDSVGEALV